MPHSKITSKGQITIPKNVRKKFNLKTGDKVDFVIENNILKLVPASKTVSEVFGMLERKNINSISVDEINIKLKKSLAEKNR
jgi:AbrB family looped-hinge helix DNA binding protein